MKDITFLDQGALLKSKNARERGVMSGLAIKPDGSAQPVSISSLAGVKNVEIRIYICYTQKILLRGGPVDVALQKIQLGDMLAAGEDTNTQLFHCAILSLAMMFFGNQPDHGRVLLRGYSLHGATLKQLNGELAKPKCHLHEDVILSVLTLTLIEIFAPTGKEHYLEHVFGLERIYELRKPTAYYSPQSIRTYKAVRRMIILASLRARRPSVLARQEWKDFLQNKSSDNEPDENFLYNVLADCSVIFAEYDDAMAACEINSESAADQMDRVIRKAIHLSKQLHAWKEQWDNAGPHFQETSPGKGTCDWNVASIPPPLTFTKASTATLFMLYHTALIYVLRLLPALSFQEATISQNQYPAAERSAALEIYRCIPYHLSTKSQLDVESLTIGQWAVSTAWTTLGGKSSSERAWLTQFLKAEGDGIVAKGVWSN